MASSASAQHRHHPYASNSSRNVIQNEGVSRNQQLSLATGPENINDQELSVSLMNAVDSMPVDELRQRVKIMTAAEPDFVRPFLMRQMEDSGRNENSNSNVQWCSCGVCRSFDDPRMNICCRQFPCITSKPEFRNLCLRHDVLEVANILNWSFRTNQDPSYQLSTFRNQAYRNFVLWQHGRLGAGRRIPVPACVCVAVRRRFPEASGQYRGYHSANSDDSE
nr:P2X purinoceptor 7-like [Crassostrea gigas]